MSIVYEREKRIGLKYICKQNELPNQSVFEYSETGRQGVFWSALLSDPGPKLSSNAVQIMSDILIVCLL